MFLFGHNTYWWKYTYSLLTISALDISSITQGINKKFCLLAQIVGAFLGYIGVTKFENALSVAELARVSVITSLTKLQNCKNIEFFYCICVDFGIVCLYQKAASVNAIGGTKSLYIYSASSGIDGGAGCN